MLNHSRSFVIRSERGKLQLIPEPTVQGLR
jgi:hypothetical protein